MNEVDWIASSDPAAMLRLVTENPDHANICCTSDRKLRLFACACCRAVWPQLADVRSRRAVEVAERYADGEADDTVRSAENQRVWGIAHGASNVLVNDEVLRKMPPDRPNPWSRLFEDCGTPAVQAHLLREIIGNPWRPVTLPKCHRCDGDGKAHGSDRSFEWSGPGSYPGNCPVCGGTGHDCPWLTPLVRDLAHAAYTERGRKCERCKGQEWLNAGHDEWDRCPDCYGTGEAGDGCLDATRLAVLADAVEEAGCQDEAILRHLRGPGPHVRGCFVLDILLGKE